MPATNLTELFDFESQFERATQAVMVANSIAAFISESTAKVPLLNTGIGFNTGPALDVMTQLTPPTNWPVGQPPPQEYFRYTGTLELRAEVPRDNNTPDIAGVYTMLGELRGTIRSAMMVCVSPFTDVNLPLYRVSDIRPNGSTTGFDQTRNIDFLAMTFTVTFSIKPTAWPVWIET